MDAFFSRFERVIKTLLRPSAVSGRQRTDTLYSEAWEELEEYLRTGESRFRSSDRGFSERRSDGRTAADHRLRPAAAAQDYRNLELEPGADFLTVKQSYRRMMLTYHPDRYAGDPERQRVATEISAKLNASFTRIRAASETP